MNIPSIIDKSLKVVQGISDNTEELAVLNSLNAKFANLVTLKNCTFKQYSNSSARTLSYYAINFQNSGSSKDFVIDTINEMLMSFIKDEMDKRIDEFKNEFELTHPLLKPKELKEELEKIRVSNIELFSPNTTGFYREAEQIVKIGFGSIFVRISELGDFISNIVGGDKSKKEFFESMKNVYEGTVSPSIIAGDGKRKTLKLIPVQCIMYTDFENLYNEKVKDYYISTLKTGLARRSYVFMPDDNNKKLEYPKKFDAKEMAFNKALELQKEIKQLYDCIKPNTVYMFSEESKEMLYDYQCKCIDYFNNTKENMILKLEKKNSFWKITKLAVIYSIVDNPTSTIVNSKYVQMAIDFYNLISPSLKRVLNERKKSEIEIYAEYMADNADKIITKTDLRQLNIVNGNKFKRFFDEHFEEIKEELESVYGYSVYNFEGKKNVKAFQLVKVGND